MGCLSWFIKSRAYVQVGEKTIPALKARINIAHGDGEALGNDLQKS